MAFADALIDYLVVVLSMSCHCRLYVSRACLRPRLFNQGCFRKHDPPVGGLSLIDINNSSFEDGNLMHSNNHTVGSVSSRRSHRKTIKNYRAPRILTSNQKSTLQLLLTSRRLFSSSSTGSSQEEIENSFSRFVPAMLPKLESYACQWKPTDIQQRSWLPIVTGRDVMGRSETGSGKTLSYVLPLVQKVLTENTKVLIIAPTRELAQQVYDATLAIISVNSDNGREIPQCGLEVGGSISSTDGESPPTFLIGTPGRLVGMHGLLQQYDVVVLDEFDLLLDLGFKKAVNQILKMTPKHRQTILISATLPESMNLSRYLKSDHTVVDCVRQQHTQAAGNLNQSYAVLPVEKFVTGVVRSILHTMKMPDHKIIVFFPTKSCAAYFSELFNTGLGRRVLELHSGVAHRRPIVSATFQNKKSNAVLFTSDVSSRGIDYPDVTTVIQVGVPRDRETHIHRIGRTARAGKPGEAILLLFEDEIKFLRTTLHDMAVSSNKKIQTLIDLPTANTSIDEDLLQAHLSVRTGSARRLKDHAESAYRAFLGFYAQHFRILNVPTAQAGELGICQ